MKSFENAVAPTSLREIAVVIPAWQPDERLIELVRALATAGFASLIVVNDGSSSGHDDLFQRVSRIASATVLQHARNCGPGRAIKTGLRYAMDNLRNLKGVVTADADGQHAVADIVHVAEALVRSGARPVIGRRTFGAGVPLRSRLGNILTQYVFWLLSGVMLTDTQCGLRGIPRELIPHLLRVRADRYEFAVSHLALFCRSGAPPVQVPIATIYFDGNRSSHFRPLRDSARIYLCLARCYASILIPGCIDFAGFAVAYLATGNLASAVLTGRLAAIVALALLQLLASDAQRDTSASFARRAGAFAVTGVIAFEAIHLLVSLLAWNLAAAKIFVECVLYLALDAIRIFFRSRVRRRR